MFVFIICRRVGTGDRLVIVDDEPDDTLSAGHATTVDVLRRRFARQRPGATRSGRGRRLGQPRLRRAAAAAGAQPLAGDPVLIAGADDAIVAVGAQRNGRLSDRHGQRRRLTNRRRLLPSRLQSSHLPKGNLNKSLLA